MLVPIQLQGSYLSACPCWVLPSAFGSKDMQIPHGAVFNAYLAGCRLRHLAVRKGIKAMTTMTHDTTERKQPNSITASPQAESREHSVITLSGRDSTAFAETLLNPREPNAALRAAAARHAKEVSS